MAEGQRHDRSALIVYGSETGTSQDAAEDLGRIAERLHFATRVSEMDDVEIVRRRTLSQTGADHPEKIRNKLGNNNRMLTYRVERTLAIFNRNICYCYNRPRRVSEERKKVLEESSQEEPGSGMLRSRVVYNIWIGR